MTKNIPQTSASERVEAAQKALDHYDAAFAMRPLNGEDAERLAASLRALITPPAVGESEDRIVAEQLHWLKVNASIALIDFDSRGETLIENALRQAARSAIQSAHESWEPADVPSQEFMLRHLGIRYEESMFSDNAHQFFIPSQYIDKEVI